MYTAIIGILRNLIDNQRRESQVPFDFIEARNGNKIIIIINETTHGVNATDNTVVPDRFVSSIRGLYPLSQKANIAQRGTSE